MPDKFASLSESQVAKKIKESANQIWLAGLGAYSKAEQEGSKIFDTLVNDGECIESKTKGQTDQQLSSAKERVSGMRERASGSWEKIEKAFDERVSKALGRLHIPTKKDVDRLNDRIDALNAAIQELVIENKEKSARHSATAKREIVQKSISEAKSATNEKAGSQTPKSQTPKSQTPKSKAPKSKAPKRVKSDVKKMVAEKAGPVETNQADTSK